MCPELRRNEFPSEKFERLAKGTLRWVLVLALLSIPFWVGRIERKFDQRIDAAAAYADAKVNAIGSRLDARDKQVEKLLTDVHQYAEQNYWDVYALNETAVTTARQFSEFVRKLDIHVNGGEGKRGVMDEVHDLLKQTREASIELEADLHKVLASTDKALAPLQEALQNVASLTSKLDRQMTTTGEGVDQTIRDLDKAITDVDKLLTDPNIAKTLENVQESTKTVEIAIRPWRERAHLLKLILGKLASMLPGVGTALLK